MNIDAQIEALGNATRGDGAHEPDDQPRRTWNATVAREPRPTLNGKTADQIEAENALLAGQIAADQRAAARNIRELARVLPLIGADATPERHRAVAERIAGEVANG